MTLSQRIAYRLFVQTIMLLVLYLLAALAGAVLLIAPDTSLARTLPYHQLGPLAGVLLRLTGLTGLLGGGIYAAAMYRADCRLANERLLRAGAALWMALLALAVAAGLLGLLEGRTLLELPPLLTTLQVIAGSAVGLAILGSKPRPPVVQVWLVGLSLNLVTSLAGLVTPGDFLQTRTLQTLATGINLYVAYPLMLVALAFWLMHRFSNVTPGWADVGIYSVAGVVTLAGALVPLSPLAALGALDWVATVGSLSALLIPVFYLIFAAHAYRALSDRNPTQTLAAHWFALALLLLLLGPGLLGALQAVPAISQWTLGTRLSDLQTTLTLLAGVVLALGMANQAAAELRGHNRRVTGFIPFWLVSFGLVIGALALAAAGVAQTYTERRLNVGYLDVQTLLVPLYALWLGGLALVALGAFIYGVTFWRRRPVTPMV
ncbi:MAG: hypothetical protein HZC41_22415 [Chloroflexi bacterium]|nr:hypothetical protein [Chloroflexota bacterium]